MWLKCQKISRHYQSICIRKWWQMNNFLVVSLEKTLEEHVKLARDYNVALEINDFYDPDVLDNPGRIEEIINRYKHIGIPAGSTMHGAFFDVILHSRDSFVRNNSRLRMKQSLDIAVKLGVNAVVFHTNYNPEIIGEDYECCVIERNAEYLKELLEAYPSINIYLENMFDDSPRILLEISKRLSNYKNYAICFDYGHALIYGDDICYWVKEIAPFVRHLHINDNDLKKDLHKAIGTGAVNWNQFASFYHQFFLDCSVLVENYDYRDQKISLDFLNTLL